MIKQLFQDLSRLLLPPLCPACNQEVIKGDAPICIHCQLTLPETNYHTMPVNRFTEHFEGRVPLERGMSLFFFNKSSRIQNLLFEIKYRNRKDLARYLGRYYGHMLSETSWPRAVDLIVPVPLHPRKLRLRGFNQSTEFSIGLGKTMQVPVLNNALARIRHTATQTRRSRQDRIKNVEGAFQVNLRSDLSGKHILLVDDVLTTGATLEACAIALQTCDDILLSMATIAMAEN